jgi:CHAT domain-containing protein
MLRQIDTLVSGLDALEETPPGERSPAAQGQARSLAARLAKAHDVYETILAQVADRDAVGAGLLGGRKASAGEVQRALATDEALIEYFVTPERLILFVVSRHDVRSVTSEIPREDLVRRVRLARDLLSARDAHPDELAAVLGGLHSLLIAPAERAGTLVRARRLVIVPHSVLAYLPFAALMREGDRQYLLQQYSFLYLPSAAALSVVRSDPVRAARVREKSAKAAAFVPFPRQLPASVREARSIRRTMADVAVYQGDAATESRLRAALAQDGVVHVATHGLMNVRSPMFSRLELARGAGDTGDDGRLEVHELLELRIGAGLVFLSGCETGVGAAWSNQFARGEDYATLAQAFLYAGARGVMATLWRIPDEGAALFAEHFYAHLARLPAPEALVAAQRDLLATPSYSAPYYWAAYQVSGDGLGDPGAHNTDVVSVPQRK